MSLTRVEVIDSQLLKFGESSCEIFLPSCAVLCVKLYPANHLLVSKQSNVSGQHNNAGLRVSIVDFEAVALLGLVPLHLNKIDKECIVKVKGSSSPGSNKARSVRVAHANSVSA